MGAQSVWSALPFQFTVWPSEREAPQFSNTKRPRTYQERRTWAAGAQPPPAIRRPQLQAKPKRRARTASSHSREPARPPPGQGQQVAYLLRAVAGLIDKPRPSSAALPLSGMQGNQI